MCIGEYNMIKVRKLKYIKIIDIILSAIFIIFFIKVYFISIYKYTIN